MRLRRARGWQDIQSILDRLSEQSRAEYESAGYPGEQFMASLAEFLAQGEVTVLEFDGEPQAFIAIKVEEPLPVTWFAATKEFYDKALATTRVARRFLKDAARRYGAIATVTGSTHPQAGKWLRVLGYEHVEGNIFLIRA